MAGEGPEKDINMAIEYFEKAAQKGERTVFSTNLMHQSTLCRHHFASYSLMKRVDLRWNAANYDLTPEHSSILIYITLFLST